MKTIGLDFNDQDADVQSKCVALGMSLMRGNAAQWLAMLNASSYLPTTFTDFEDKLKAKYKYTDLVEHARD